MAALKDKNLWIIVCEGDTKAFPGMNAATARWEALGAKVARNDPFWDSKAPAREIEAGIKAMNGRARHQLFGLSRREPYVYMELRL